MRILVEVVSGGACTLLTAWTDHEDDEKYMMRINGEEQAVNSVTVMHNEDTNALHPCFRKQQVHRIGWNVTFESRVNFKTFCEQFAASRFNDKNNYHWRNHNCAMAVAYALTLAGIDHKLPAYRVFNRVGSLSTDRMPLASISPLDLIHHLIQYKTQTLKPHTLSFKLELAKSAMNMWNSRHPQPRQKRLIATINHKMSTMTHLHPELDETYLKIFLDTTDFLLGTPSPKEKEEYHQLAGLFDRMHPYKNNEGSATLLNTAVAASMLMFALKYFGLPVPYQRSAAVVSISVVTVLASKNYANYLSYRYGSENMKREPTTLSNAMRELSGVRMAAKL